MKMMNKVGALLLSAVLCIGMAAPAFAYGGEPVEEVEQPVLTDNSEEDAVTVTDETSGALTPEGNLTLVDDYHTNYSDGSGQQFITLVSKSGNTFYLVIDRNAKGQQTLALVGLVAGGGIYTFMKQKQKKQAEKEALDPDADYTEDKGDFEIPTDVPDEEETPDEQDTEPI